MEPGRDFLPEHMSSQLNEGGNGLIGETVVFNYIGRILHDKGVDDYIAAAKIIKSEYPNSSSSFS